MSRPAAPRGPTPPLRVVTDAPPLAGPAPRRAVAPRRRLRLALEPALFLAPAAIAFAAFVVWPIIGSVWVSLHDWDGIGEARWVGLGNYRELMEDPDFRVALLNNVRWLALFLLAPPLGLAAALFLNHRFLGARAVKTLFFFPFVLSPVVIGMAFTWFYDPMSGLLNALLAPTGFGPTAILATEGAATYGVIVAGLWPQVAYCMIIYLTGLTTVDPEVVEAARLDGARGLRMVRHILLPQLAPATFLAVVVTVIGALRSFDLIAIMTRGGPFGSTKVLAFKMVEESLGNYRMGYGAAYAVVLFAIMVAYTAYAMARMLRAERMDP